MICIAPEQYINLMIRPQDPIWQEGFESLSTAELIALLIKGSSPHWQAELLGAQLMAKVGQNLAALERSSLAELTAIKGIGRSRALSLLAAFELGRRRRDSPRRLSQTMECSKNVFDFIRPSLGHLDHEEFWVLFLNAAHGLEGISQLSKGGVTATVVDLRLLIKKSSGLSCCRHDFSSQSSQWRCIAKRVGQKINATNYSCSGTNGFESFRSSHCGRKRLF